MPKPPANAMNPTVLFTAIITRCENRPLDISDDTASQPFAEQMCGTGILAADEDEPHTYMLTDKGHHTLRLLESVRDYALGIHTNG